MEGNSKVYKSLICDFNGTTPVYTHYFAKSLVNEKIDVTILGREDLSELSIFSNQNIYIDFYKKISNKFLAYLISWFYLLWNCKKYNSVYIQWFNMTKKCSIDIWLLTILKLRNAKIYYVVHNVFPHDTNSEKVKKRYLKLYRKVPNLLVHTPETIEKLKYLYIDFSKCTLIYHGLFYYDLFDNLKCEKKYTLAMIGSIKKYKGIEDYIELVEILSRNKSEKIKVLLAGNGDVEYVKKLNELIINKGVQELFDCKFYHLEINEMISLYRESKIIVAPYKQIEQSGVVLTALGLGVPILGYSIGGIKDVIVNGKNGYLTESNTSEALIQGYEYLDKMGDLSYNCKNSLKNRNWEETGKILFNLERR